MANGEDRRDWPYHTYPLGQEPGDDLSATTTAEERIAMMWPLALDAWALAGLPLPTYSRAETPIRMRPLGAPEDDPSTDD